MRRCTGAAVDLVSGAGVAAGRGGAGCTRMPRAGAAGAGGADGAGLTVVGRAEGAGRTEGVGPGAAPATGTTAAGRSKTAGADPGGSVGVDVRWSSRPPDRPSRTAGDGEPVKEGLRQVASRLPKPASATPAESPLPAARCTGGNVDQAAGRGRTGTESAPAPDAVSAPGTSGPGPGADAPPPTE
ncbi:hypothetical protein P1P75_33670 [Streptomyces sp. ID05-39B]|uniref:hypothetical protein n=1 Tax=Streptomyces sp. ID05-39B TaxID=3028664 RepID=UPI0029AA9437|nr:hypothetical protein [Streptomyces sp. ID05-39B]MDX3531223.1 hypothetical protein [Streptomyces sp. ID05-39B]